MLNDVMSEQAAQDLLESIFKLAAELVGGQRVSLLLRDDNDRDFVIAKALGLAEELRAHVRVREGEGVAGHVAATKRPLLVRRREEAPGAGAGSYRTESFVSVPIVIGDRAEGVLNVAERADGRPFEQSDLETLQLLANHIATCLVRQQLDRQLRELAESDQLTGLFNRRHFERRIQAEFDRARRAEQPLALLLIDVNSFKAINDRLGHSVGDDVLRTVAAALRDSVRTYDVPVRYGGDEFAVILPNADPPTARRVGDRIVTAVAGAIAWDIVTAVPGVGISIGVATAPPAGEIQTLIEHADAAMYRAKDAGGGVALWETEEGRPARRARESLHPTPFLADPTRLADRDLQALVPQAIAEEWNVLVIGREGSVITVVMPEPSNPATEAISAATGLAVYPVYSAAVEIERARHSIR